MTSTILINNKNNKKLTTTVNNIKTKKVINGDNSKYKNIVNNKDESMVNFIENVNKFNLMKSEYNKKIKYQNKRLTLFPIQYNKQYEMFKKQQAHFWTTEGIDFTDDKVSFKLLPNEIQTFFKITFATFNVLDSVVNDNVADIKDDLPDTYLEANNFYYAQGFIEAIHMETYSTIMDVIIDSNERDYWLNIAKNAKFVRDKIDNAIKYQGHESPLEVRVIANGCVEGIGFCSLFPPIFWTKNIKGVNIIPGARFGNEEISIDESLHKDFAVILYHDLIKDAHIKKLSTQQVHEIVDSYSKSEMSTAKYFYTEELEKLTQYYKNLPNDKLSDNEKNIKYYFEMFDEMKYDNVCSYIKYIADQYLLQLGYPKLYYSDNPFPFMEKIKLGNKSNFFEKRVAEYSHININNINNNNNNINNNINNSSAEINYDF
jgi:ribonucleotide reductase beta subunit family protein with ferritin-like domain